MSQCPKCQSPLAEGATFCSQCGSQFGAAAETTPKLPSASATALEAIAARDYEVRIGAWISRGWEIYKANLGPILGAYLVMCLILVIGAFVPFGNLILPGPIMGGMIMLIFVAMRGKTPEFNMIFKGFSRFAPLMLVNLVRSILVLIGIVLCVLPGIYLGVGYMFSIFLVVDKNAEFWPALETSRKLIHRHWFGIFLFLLALAGINILGMLALCIGVLFTGPLTMCALCAAYEDIVGLEPETPATALVNPA